MVSAVISQAWDRFYKNGWLRAETSFIAAEPVQDLIADGPMPSPAAVVADLSLKLAHLTDDEKLRKQTLSALNSGGSLLEKNEFWHASHIGAMLAALERR